MAVVPALNWPPASILLTFILLLISNQFLTHHGAKLISLLFSEKLGMTAITFMVIFMLVFMVVGIGGNAMLIAAFHVNR